MRKKNVGRADQIAWGRVLRRAAALFMATMTAWGLFMVSGAGAAEAFRSIGENPAFVSAVLQAELGSLGIGDGPLAEMDVWQRLVLSQSAVLRSGAHLDAPQGEDSSPDPAGADPDSPIPPGQPAQDPDDLTEDQLPQTTSAPEDIVEKTLIPNSTQGYLYAGGVYLYNRTGLSPDLAALTAAPVNITLPKDEPQILIMHTHGTEAYTPDGSDIYTPSDNNSRTLDDRYNMLRVGDEMERVFTEMGLSVLHDRTIYDYPQYNGAYGRSAQGVQAYLEQYPSIRIVLDVHRDALIAEDGTVYKAVTTVDGAKTAQVMLVLGSSEGGEHPNWEQNLTLAAKIQQGLNSLYPTLARPITLRSPVYNQNLTTGSLLVEVGTHGNTLQEALNAARLFARAAGQVLLGLEAAQ